MSHPCPQPRIEAELHGARAGRRGVGPTSPSRTTAMFKGKRGGEGGRAE